MSALDAYPCPLVAILRGLTVDEVPMVGPILFDAGFRLLEVPLNRPGALEAMQELLKDAPDDALVGGGTILTTGDVDAVRNAGGRLMVSPNCDVDVIRHAVQTGMVALPGVATPTEAFAALAAGAAGLKLFPAEMIQPPVVKSLRSVIPAGVALLPVGGIHPNNMDAYIAAGASGFGIGGQLYRPGIGATALKAAAQAFMAVRRSFLQHAAAGQP
jgi:2-dehydro-3-deoxyphosphogalactonate aldolase